MHFGENQLSRSLIGLSPLPTVHPPGFQPWWVRSSTQSYLCFNLTMGRSPRFGSRTRDKRQYFRLAFATHTPHGLSTPRITNSQAHSSKGTPSPHKALTAYRHTVSGTISLPSRGTFHHSLTVLSAIGHNEYSGLPGGPGRFTADSTSPLLLGAPRNPTTHAFTYRTLTVYGRPFQTTSASTHDRATDCQTSRTRPHNPDHATPDRYHTQPV